MSLYIYGSVNFTNPGIPGSRVYLLGSPLKFPAPNVEPWYERYLEKILFLPVYILAIFIAFSFASAPAFVKKTFPMLSGIRLMISFARAALSLSAYASLMNAYWSTLVFIASFISVFP